MSASTKQIEVAIKECAALRDIICKNLEITLRPYQLAASNQIIISTLAANGDEIGLFWARQCGKTEAVIISVVALALYNIKFLSRHFRVGIFAPAHSQSILVDKERLQERLKALALWLKLEGIEIYLGSGRTTELFIIRDSTGYEARIRALSADPEANIKAETLHLIITEQTEDMDQAKLKADIFPMGASTGACRVLTGTANLTIRNKYFYDLITANPNHSLISTIDHQIASQYSDTYRDYVNREKARLGEESDEFKAMYGLEWSVLRNKLIPDRNLFLALSTDYAPDMGNLRGAGVDIAKEIDSTVAIVGERKGEHTHILDWLELQGTNYEQQAEAIRNFLEPWKVSLIHVDATGVGDPVVDMLKNRVSFAQVVGIKFTTQQEDRMAKVLEREILATRLHYPLKPSRNRDRFIEQMLDCEKTYRKNELKLEAPQGLHDDYVKAAELMLNALAGGAPYRSSIL